MLAAIFLLVEEKEDGSYASDICAGIGETVEDAREDLAKDFPIIKETNLEPEYVKHYEEGVTIEEITAEIVGLLKQMSAFLTAAGGEITGCSDNMKDDD